MTYKDGDDPFLMVIDMQLQSLSGWIEYARTRASCRLDRSSFARRAGMRFHRRKEALEDALIWAYDQKYHNPRKKIERAVADMVRRGYTEREIARTLGIGKGTIWRIKQRLRTA